MTEDKDVYVKYSEIWDKILKILKLKFSNNLFVTKNT